MVAKKDEKAGLEARVAKLEDVVDGLAAKVRGMSDNWHKFVSKHVGGGAANGAIVGLILVAGMVAISYAANLVNYPTPSGGTGFVVTDAGNATVGGTLTVNGATTLTGATTQTGALTVTGTLTASTLLAATPVSATCTNGGSIAVTGSYVKVTPTNVATATVANASSAGQILIIENVGTNALTIADNGTAMALGSDAVLGTTDTLTLVANAAAQWRKLATSNN